MTPEPFILDPRYFDSVEGEKYRKVYVQVNGGRVGAYAALAFPVVFYTPALVLFIVAWSRDRPQDYWDALLAVGLATPFLLGGLLAFFFARSDAREHEKFARDARLVPGTLTKIFWRRLTPERDPQPSYSLEAHFEFTYDSKTVTGMKRLPRDDLLNATLAEPGTPVYVFMTDGQHYIML